ncbi:hypothetical protein ACFE04_011503 [Oxalis oulophora]
MGKYEVDIHGVRINVTVVSVKNLTESHVTQLSQQILQSRLNYWHRSQVLEIYANKTTLKNLLAQLSDMTFRQVLNGTLMKDECAYRCQKGGHKTWVNLGEFVARVLQKPQLVTEKLWVLAREVGLNSFYPTPVLSVPEPDWGANIFPKEVSYAIQNVYDSYVIAKKTLTDLLPAANNLRIKNESG